MAISDKDLFGKMAVSLRNLRGKSYAPAPQLNPVPAPRMMRGDDVLTAVLAVINQCPNVLKGVGRPSTPAEGRGCLCQILSRLGQLTDPAQVVEQLPSFLKESPVALSGSITAEEMKVVISMFLELEGKFLAAYAVTNQPLDADQMSNPEFGTW